MKLVNYILVLFAFSGVFIAAYGQSSGDYRSKATGNWSTLTNWERYNGTIWEDATALPGSSNNVTISAGNIVTVDVESSCKDISFGDANARLGLNANLNIYGNFNRFDTSVNPFLSGINNLWTAGAKLVFAGSAASQTITNLGTTSSTPFPLRFDELVIDKTSGKFTTGGGNFKLGIGASLEVKNGTFELDTTDDIEGRNAANSATSPDIIVRAGAIFDMVGSSSVIRRGNFVGDETSKLGKLTVFGTANLVFGGRVNFSGIDIENGGNADIPLGRGTTSSTFNSGVITIKNGGKLKNNLNTAFWYSNATIQPSITINDGGEYEASSTATTLPIGGIIQNSGSIIRFSSSSSITLPTGISSYKNLYISNAGIKTLGAKTTIDELLQISGSAAVGLGDHSLEYGASATLRYGASGQSTAQTTSDSEWPITNGPTNVQVYNTGGVTLHDNRTVGGTLTLTLGQFDNNGSSDDKILTLSDGATISRARGSLSASPVFGASVNVNFTSTTEAVTTGSEIPVSTTTLNNLSVTSSQGISLGANIQVNGTLSVTGGNVTTGNNTLTLGPTATITESAGKTVVGNLTTTRTVAQNLNNNFGGIGVEINASNAAPGATVILRKTGTATTGNSNEGIKRYFDISPATNTGLNATLVFKYDESELNSIPEANLVLFKSTNAGTDWSLEGGTVNTTTNTITKTGVNSFSRWTAGNSSTPLPVEITSFNYKLFGNSISLHWNTASEINSYLFEIENSTDNAVWEKIGEVRANGNSNAPKDYQFTVQKMSTGKYLYRLKMIDNDGSFEFSNSIEVNLLTPTDYSVSQNYPNPFNPLTKIDYQLPFDSQVTIELYGMTGEKVATLVNAQQSAGYYSTEINSNDFNLVSGIYLYRMVALNKVGKEFVQIKKLMLLK